MGGGKLGGFNVLVPSLVKSKVTSRSFLFGVIEETVDVLILC